MRNYIFILTILSLYTVSDGSLTVCISIDKLKSNGQLEYYSELIKALKEDLTSLLEDDNFTASFAHLDFDFVHPVLAAKGAVDNVTVTNINDFNLKFFKGLNILTNKLELFNLTFHNISIKGEYDIYGNIGELFDIYGKGDFWLNLLDFSISALADLPIINSTEACLTFDIYAALQRVEGWFYNLMNDDELEELLNGAIRAVVPEAVEVIWLEVKDAVDERLQQLIDVIIQTSSLHVLAGIVQEQKMNFQNEGVVDRA